MHYGRTGHTATRLPNGLVMIAGGTTNSSINSLASVELYNPDTGAWTETTSMADPHQNHTATLLGNGHVLIADGYTANVIDAEGTLRGVSLSSVEIYDPTTERWIYGGDLTSRRANHTSTALLNGEILFTGGHIEQVNYPYWIPLSNAERYVPNSGTASSLVICVAKVLNGTLEIAFTGTPGRSFSALSTANLDLKQASYDAGIV
jgi:Kelch motif